MVEPGFTEAFSEEWKKQNIENLLNELVILRQIIPWQRITDRLTSFYCKGKGRMGKSLRMMAALLLLARLRHLSDAEVVRQVKENRYMQYFCNIPDRELRTFLNPSALCTFRKRLGPEGVRGIEEEIFGMLRRSGVIRSDAQLIDSTVLPNHMIYPTDVLLLYKAFGKMAQFAQRNKLPVWWDAPCLKKRWRACHLAKKKEKHEFLWEFYLLFSSALQIFRIHVQSLSLPAKEREKARSLETLLNLLEVQTEQKLAGEIHIENRIVSLDETDARPIKKGKSHPSCEFGTTLQMSFNREGFLITTENFIGSPGDKTLYPSTAELFRERMKTYADVAVTDQGFRSSGNIKISKGKIGHVFMGRSEDVCEDKQDFCRRARSATEGFIAVAKNLRGFRKSLYRGLNGDRMWTCLCQAAYNLKKFLQLFRDEEKPMEEKILIRLGLLAA